MIRIIINQLFYLYAIVNMSKTLALDHEIKQCAITKPYEALQTDFAKKIIDHIASDSKFKEQHIKEIADKLYDEAQTLTPEEWKDFLVFMEEHTNFFDGIIKRYQWKFPAWIQSAEDPSTLDMKREDHVLYLDGTYLSLRKIRNYVKSRIKGHDDMWPLERIDLTLNKEAVDRMYYYTEPRGEAGMELYKKFTKLSYSNRVNKNGITIHNINGIAFAAIDSPDVIKPRLSMKDMNNDPEDYTKGKSFANLKNNQKYKDFLQKADAKAFASLEESNTFQFKLMNAIANQLGQNVYIDADFVDRPQNKIKVLNILACLYALTHTEIWIPYKFDERGMPSFMYCIEWDWSGIVHPDTDDEWDADEDSPISFFLEVEPSLGKERS